MEKNQIYAKVPNFKNCKQSRKSYFEHKSAEHQWRMTSFDKNASAVLRKFHRIDCVGVSFTVVISLSSGASAAAAWWRRGLGAATGNSGSDPSFGQIQSLPAEKVDSSPSKAGGIQFNFSLDLLPVHANIQLQSTIYKYRDTIYYPALVFPFINLSLYLPLFLSLIEALSLSTPLSCSPLTFLLRV